MKPETQNSDPVKSLVMRKLGTYIEEYRSLDGHVMRREWGKTPNDNYMNGRWVLREKDGNVIDWDKYRSDIAERNNIKLIHA